MTAVNKTNPQNRKTRVADKSGGILDAAEQALKIEKLSSAHDLLAQRVAHGMENVANSMASVQMEVRSMTSKLGDVAALQLSHESSREGMAEVRRQLVDMNSRLESFFDDFDQRQDRRWAQYEANRDAWRREHEAENENTKRDHEMELRKVRETTIRFGATAGAVVLLSGAIVTGFLYNINYRFNENKDTIAEVKATAITHRNLIDRNQEVLNDIKLYLARGGRIPDEPYTPPSQRNQDGNADQARARQPAK
jgi:hypothetical protein